MLRGHIGPFGLLQWSGLLAILAPFKQIGQGGCNAQITVYEATVKVGETQKDLNISIGLRLWPVLDDGHPFDVHGYPRGGDHKA